MARNLGILQNTEWRRSMKIGDLVRYIPYGHTDPCDPIGLIIRVNDGVYEVYWPSHDVETKLIRSELEVVNESR